MKRFFVLAILFVLLLPLCLGQLASTQITPVMISSQQSRWVELGTITSQQAYPAVGDLDYTTVAALADAKTITWDLSATAGNKRQLSFQTSADADSTTVALFGFADNSSVDTTGAFIDDDAVYLGQLVLTGGKQVGKHSNVYVDTIVATDGVWDFTVVDSAADRRCLVDIASDKGFRKVVIVATTLQASSTLYAEGRSMQ